MAVTTTENSGDRGGMMPGECQPNGGIHMLVDYFDKEAQKMVKRCHRCKTIIKRPQGR